MRGSLSLLVMVTSLMVRVHLSIMYSTAPPPPVGVQTPSGLMYLVDAATYHANMTLSMKSNTNCSYAMSVATELRLAIRTVSFPPNIGSRVNNIQGSD